MRVLTERDVLQLKEAWDKDRTLMEVGRKAIEIYRATFNYDDDGDLSGPAIEIGILLGTRKLMANRGAEPFIEAFDKILDREKRGLSNGAK